MEERGERVCVWRWVCWWREEGKKGRRRRCGEGANTHTSTHTHTHTHTPHTPWTRQHTPTHTVHASHDTHTRCTRHTRTRTHKHHIPHNRHHHDATNRRTHIIRLAGPRLEASCYQSNRLWCVVCVMVVVVVVVVWCVCGVFVCLCARGVVCRCSGVVCVSVFVLSETKPQVREKRQSLHDTMVSTKERKSHVDPKRKNERDTFFQHKRIQFSCGQKPKQLA